MMKKKVFMSSILTIAICLCLIAGSTFALFTSESTVNVAVQAATVDVVATAKNFKLSSSLGANVPETLIDYDPSSNVVKVVNMVPGDKIEFDIEVTNHSNVTVDYRTKIAMVDDNGLWSGLKITYGVSGGFSAPSVLGNQCVVSQYATLTPGSHPGVVHVTITLPESAGNEYQNTTCSFAYTVEAVQGNAQ
jgi:predicted ribosomally synthesized peptide with SipW-like signal peptide